MPTTYTPSQMAAAINSFQPTINLQSKTVSPALTQSVIQCDNGYDGLEQVTVKQVVVSNTLIAANVKKDVVIEIGDPNDSDSMVRVVGTFEGGSSVQPTLNAPSISLSNDMLTITANSNNGNFVTGYKIYDGANLIATIQILTYNLSSLPDAVHTITVKAYGTKFNDSAASNSVTYDNSAWAEQDGSDLSIGRAYSISQSGGRLSIE